MSSTPHLDPESWERTVELFERLAELSADRREEVLEGEPPAIGRAVRRMLAGDATTASVLDEGMGGLADLAIDGADPIPDLHTGTRVGDFEIRGVLGRGGMGIVYEARDTRLDRIAALKFLPPERQPAASVGARTTTADRLLSEARAASALDHPNIATVYQVGEAAGRPFIAMARYEGETLRTRLKRGPLSKREALDIAIQVARGLAAAHRAGIVHRDVKPGNIFITSSGLVKLLDFGIAAAGHTDGDAPRAGTLNYMSPEQARRDTPVPSSDVWSLGVTLSEMLTGDVRRDSSAVGSRGRLHRVLVRALSTDPSQRYRDGAELLTALEKCRNAMGAPRRLAVIAAVAAVAALLMVGLRDPTADTVLPAVASVAVGRVEAPGDHAELADEATGLVAAALGRLDGLALVSEARMQQLRSQMADLGADSVDRDELAALAGAESIIVGALEPDRDGTYRLELSRRELSTGESTPLASGEGRDLEAVAEGVVSSAARLLGVSAPRRSAPLGSHSGVATRLYEEGLRAYYEADLPSARRLFASALEEDPSFTMAAFYHWRSLGTARSDSALLKMVKGAATAPERERLIVRAQWAYQMYEPIAEAYAESLVVRHPQELDGHFLLGAVGARTGNPSATAHLRNVVELDSLSLRAGSRRCMACDAFGVLVGHLQRADSLAAAEQAAREWLQYRPGSARAWSTLAYVLEQAGRQEEAHEARRESARLLPGNAMASVFPARYELRHGRWTDADRLLAERIRNAAPDHQRLALWFLAISLREQGRLREALETERVRFQRTPFAVDDRPSDYSHFEGQILTELGRWDDARMVFEHLVARGRRSWPEGRAAARMAWAMGHLATALAAEGDRRALAELTDSLEAVGARSVRQADRRRHHYARGLLRRLEGDAAAAEGEFRQALTSLSGGFSRINLELARVLIDQGRAEEAIPILEAPLPGVLESVHLYLSRTELHENLGRAYDLVGSEAEALEHYRWAARAWEDADLVLAARRDALLARIGELERR